MLCVLTADIVTKPAAEQDDGIDTKASQSVDSPLSGIADDVALNFDDDWEKNVDDLVSWTNALNL